MYARFDGADAAAESVSRGYVPLFAGPYPDFTEQWSVAAAAARP